MRVDQLWQRIYDPPTQPERHTRQSFAELSASEQADWDNLRRSWHADLPVVRLPQIAPVLEEFQATLAHNRRRSAGTSRGVLVDGQSGIGKTSCAFALTKWLQLDRCPTPPVLQDVEAIDIPVISITMPTSSTARQLTQRVADSIGAPLAGNAQQMLDRLIGSFSTHGTEALIIDEAHRAGTGKHGRDVMAWAKELLDANVAVVALGTNLRTQPIYTGVEGEDSPFSSRSTYHHLVPLAAPGESDEWGRFVAAREGQLRLLDHPASSLAAAAAELWSAFTGYVQAFDQALERAASSAEGDSEVVTVDDLVGQRPTAKYA